MEGPAIMEAYLGVGISFEDMDSALATPADAADGFRSEATVIRASTTARPARKYLGKCKRDQFRDKGLIILKSLMHVTFVPWGILA